MLTFSQMKKQAADTVIDSTTNKVYTATEKTKLSAITGTNTGDQTAATVANTPAGNVVDSIMRGVLNHGM